MIEMLCLIDNNYLSYSSIDAVGVPQGLSLILFF